MLEKCSGWSLILIQHNCLVPEKLLMRKNKLMLYMGCLNLLNGQYHTFLYFLNFNFNIISYNRDTVIILYKQGLCHVFLLFFLFSFYKYMLLNRTCTIKCLKQNKSGTLLGTVKQWTSLTRRYMNLRKSK